MSHATFLKSLFAAFTMIAWLIPAQAGPSLLIDAESGDILQSDAAIASWHPASLTKLMTAHLALMQVRAGRITMDTPVIMSRKAAAQPPSKLGLAAGHALRLEDALRIILVRSANDVAVAIAETLSGDEARFALAMNQESARLGMTGTRFRNASGLHDPEQVTNARDMALLAMAILRAHADHYDIFGMPFITYGGKRIDNTNKLVGSYPGVDGMKTGYICASGYGLVTTAQRDGRRLISVVMGAGSQNERTDRTRALLDLGFSGVARASGNIRGLRAEAPAPATDLSSNQCGRGVEEIEERISPTVIASPPKPAPRPRATPASQSAPVNAVQRF